MLSLGQDEPFYTCTHQKTQHFITKACYGCRVRAIIQEFKSNLCTKIRAILQIRSKTNSRDICNLMQEYNSYVNGYKEELGIEFIKMTGSDEDYRLSNKEEK